MGNEKNGYQPANDYTGELNKFIGKKVVVVTKKGQEYEGICQAIGINHLNVIIRTDKEKIMFKDIDHIRRARDHPQ